MKKKISLEILRAVGIDTELLMTKNRPEAVDLKTAVTEQLLRRGYSKASIARMLNQDHRIVDYYLRRHNDLFYTDRTYTGVHNLVRKRMLENVLMC